jgi:hypothetical protein
MTHPHHDSSAAADRQIERGLDQARRLGESRPAGRYTPEWYTEATHVGDLTALAALTLSHPRRT